VEAVPVKPPGRIARMGARLRAAYFRAAGSRWFTAVVVVVFVVGALVGFGQAIVAIGSASAFVMTLLVVLAMAAVLVSIRQWDTSATARWLTGTATIAAGIVALALVWIFERGGGVPQLTFAEWGTLISSLVAGLFVLFGIWRLRTSRVAAYEMFLRAVLVAIFFSQVFNFYRDARVALAGVIVDIIIYGVLRYMIAQEEAAAGANPAPPAAAGTGQ
jgi:hypothetical protein